nr:hypothetical protein [Tanacetum cinerariifolium]
MTAGQRKPKAQCAGDERKAANLAQRLKSLIMSVLSDDQMITVINWLTFKSTWDDLILYHEGSSDVKENRVMDLKMCYNTFKYKEGETLTQTFTRYKALMNEFVNDDIKPSKLEINTVFINGLPKKWLSFCQSFRNINHVKETELASLFGAFFSTFVVQDFQDSLDDEEDTRSRLVAKVYEWDEEDFASDDNDMTEVKVLMVLADDENVVVGKESTRND